MPIPARLAVLLLGLLALAPAAWAQGAPIRLIVPFPPGGASDTAGRITGQAIAHALNRPVVVENRPGAGGLIGGEALARAPNDGSVIGLSNLSPQGIAPLISARPPYDPARDFTHIALVAETPSVMVVRADSPIRSLADYLAAARARPGVNYGSSGIGSPQHLQGELLSQLGHVALVHVPYRGNAPGLQDVLAGQLDMMLSPLAGLTGAIQGGQIRVVGVTSAERFAALPDVATFAEQGFPQLTMTSWSGISGPAGMAPDLVARLNAVINAAIQTPEVAGQLRAAGLYPPARPLDAAGYHAIIAGFPAIWAPVIRAANIAPGG